MNPLISSHKAATFISADIFCGEPNLGTQNLCKEVLLSCKYKSRASEGLNGAAGPNVYLSYLVNPSFFHGCDLTFKIPIKSLDTPRDLRKFSPDRANILLAYLAKAGCLRCARLSCSGLLFGREAHWTWAAKKNVLTLSWKEAFCTWKRPTNLQDTWKFDGSSSQTESPCTQRLGYLGLLGVWAPGIHSVFLREQEALLQAAPVLLGACNNPTWGWTLNWVYAHCTSHLLIGWGTSLPAIWGQWYARPSLGLLKDTCSLPLLPELLFSSRQCWGWTWIWILGSRQVFHPILNIST